MNFKLSCALALALVAGSYAWAQDADNKAITDLSGCEGWMTAGQCSTIERLKSWDKYIPWANKTPAASSSAPASSSSGGYDAPIEFGDGAEAKAERDWVALQAQKGIAEREDAYRHELAELTVLDNSTLKRLNSNCTDNEKPDGYCMNDVADAKRVLQRALVLLQNKEAAAYINKVRPGWLPTSPDRAAKVKMPVPGYEFTPLKSAPTVAPSTLPAAKSGAILRRGGDTGSSLIQTSLEQADQWERDRPAREAREKAEAEARDRKAAQDSAEYQRQAQLRREKEARDSAAFKSFLGAVAGVAEVYAEVSASAQSQSQSYTSGSTVAAPRVAQVAQPPRVVQSAPPSEPVRQDATGCVRVVDPKTVGVKSNFALIIKNSCGYTVVAVWDGGVSQTIGPNGYTGLSGGAGRAADLRAWRSN